ncbi:ABC transporter substrate-binding protein [Acidianus sulfidivorans JP7]|uniref:Sulfate-binding protein n=1 Tax=Acidianus sulfidivorans JP7 TaxID=619593 RepID=A0A2U9IKP4_9CREN|nr:substrate-binding domain-containing protein [Acidianus sulfidivorans]AWR96599.1 ABC transporter substrate-binding protein [Acidianus sulfidivorans JP7]
MDLTLQLFDVLEDVWGDTSGVKLSFAGNQWFVAKELLNFFNKNKYKIYLETIPPGFVRKRIEGESLKIGNLEITFKPEIVSLPPSMLQGLEVEKKVEYAENDLVIVYRGKEVRDWCDLKGKRAAIPNPNNEGIGQLFKELYEEQCGSYDELLNYGGIYITKVHHREIPHMLKLGDIEAGVVWRTEAIFWGFKYSVPERNKVGKLAFALLKNSSEEAKNVFNLLLSEEVKNIYKKYEFKWIA